jgi:hypothetical protein
MFTQQILLAGFGSGLYGRVSVIMVQRFLLDVSEWDYRSEGVTYRNQTEASLLREASFRARQNSAQDYETLFVQAFA